MTYMHSYSLICVYIDLISFDMKLSVVYYFAFVTVGSTLRYQIYMPLNNELSIFQKLKTFVNEELFAKKKCKKMVIFLQ